MSSKCLQEKHGYFWISWKHTCYGCGIIHYDSGATCQLHSQLQSCFSQLLKHPFNLKHLVSPILCHEARKVLGIAHAPDQRNRNWNSSRSMRNRALPIPKPIWQLTTYLELLKYSRMWDLKVREGERVTTCMWSHPWLRNNSGDFSVVLLLSMILFLFLSFGWKNMFEPSGCRNTRGCFGSRFWVLADSQRLFFHPARSHLSVSSPC